MLIVHIYTHDKTNKEIQLFDHFDEQRYHYLNRK